MIPGPLLKEILDDEFYQTCIRSSEKTCEGRITFEHTLIYAGRQIQEKWAIVPLCAFHHDVNEWQDAGDLQKEVGVWVSVSRASKEDLKKYPKRDWAQLRRYLTAKYGKYKRI